MNHLINNKFSQKTEWGQLVNRSYYCCWLLHHFAPRFSRSLFKMLPNIIWRELALPVSEILIYSLDDLNAVFKKQSLNDHLQVINFWSQPDSTWPPHPVDFKQRKATWILILNLHVYFITFTNRRHVIHFTQETIQCWNYLTFFQFYLKWRAFSGLSWVQSLHQTSSWPLELSLGSVDEKSLSCQISLRKWGASKRHRAQLSEWEKFWSAPDG